MEIEKTRTSATIGSARHPVSIETMRPGTGSAGTTARSGPRPDMASRSCACGCGQPILGQRSKKFYSDSHRKRFNRSGRTLEPTQRSPAKRESRTPPELATGTPNVRALDSRTEVSCSACGRPLPRLYGPVQVNAYCADCVQAERCPCYSRPAWHQWGRKPERARAA